MITSHYDRAYRAKLKEVENSHVMGAAIACSSGNLLLTGLQDNCKNTSCMLLIADNATRLTALSRHFMGILNASDCNDKVCIELDGESLVPNNFTGEKKFSDETCHGDEGRIIDEQ
ncbi:unnamed protein product [Citrullus colocynthis]|uniref:Uncharacterized protein n=1 Tax=Citrullus colocynthis TaxID=252529 RepID=A0ABP0Y5C2_9ROSI